MRPKRLQPYRFWIDRQLTAVSQLVVGAPRPSALSQRGLRDPSVAVERVNVRNTFGGATEVTVRWSYDPDSDWVSQVVRSTGVTAGQCWTDQADKELSWTTRRLSWNYLLS